MPSQAVFGLLLLLQQTLQPSNGSLPLIIIKAGDGMFFLDPAVLKRQILPLCFFMCAPYSADIDTETAARSWCDIDMSVHRPFSGRVLLQTVCHMSHAAHAGCLATPNTDLKGKSQDMVSEVAVLIILKSKKAPYSKMRANT